MVRERRERASTPNGEQTRGGEQNHAGRFDGGSDELVHAGTSGARSSERSVTLIPGPRLFLRGRTSARERERAELGHQWQCDYAPAQ